MKKELICYKVSSLLRVCKRKKVNVAIVEFRRWFWEEKKGLEESTSTASHQIGSENEASSKNECSGCNVNN